MIIRDSKANNKLSESDLQNHYFYRLGAISYIIIAAAIVFSIVAFFIWPYKPGSVSTENILHLLQTDRLGGLISLDLPMLVIIPINIIPMLVLYFILKRVNEFSALMALVLSLVGVALLIPTRPLIELVTLSNQYAAATSETVRIRTLASSDLLLLQFNGTAWFIQIIILSISGIINGILMLRSPIFRRSTAVTELALSILGLGFFVPVIFILNTIGAVVFYILVAVDLFKTQRQIDIKASV